LELIGLIGRVLERVISWLPGWVIRSKYPPATVASHFFLELASPRALQVTLQSASSRIGLSLVAINLSPISIDIEHFDFSLSVGNLPLYSGQILRRQRVEGFSTFPELGYGMRGWGGPSLYFDIQIDSGRADAIVRSIPQWHGPFEVQLRIHVYGRCKTGPIERTDISFDVPSGGAGIG
jgi:hypothetical protein